MRREDKGIFYNIDWPLVIMYLVMVFIGWINIYAAVFNEEHRSILDMSQNYGKQLLWIGTALLLAMVLLIIESSFYVKFASIFYVLSILLLIAVFALGVEINGSRSWLAVGEFRVQPAEFAKFSTGLMLAKFLSDLNIKFTQLKTKLLAFIIIAIPPALVIMQNETGSALVFGAFVFVLYREGLSGNILLFGILLIALFIFTLLFEKILLISILGGISLLFFLFGRRKLRNVLVALGFFIVTAGTVYSVGYVFEEKLQPHQKKRIEVLLGKEKDLKGAGYNVNQSKIAIGSGGFFGKGFLQGTQTKFNFVPEQSTDFIFCTIGEEWGFVGSFVVISLFVLFLIRLVQVAERQRSPFSRIYGYCVASIIFMHFLVNIGMTIGLAPVIGIPLPFFSYGGSSLWSFTILLFIFIRLDSARLQILR